MLTIEQVGEADLPELMPMLRAYCDFYRVDPPDERLTALVTALIANPPEGLQLIARDSGTPVGFATIYWTWQTLHAARVGVLNDLYVVPGVRGGGTGRALIERCRELCREHGAAMRIVALTGYGESSDRERARASGFDELLVKPVDPERLLRMLGA